MSIRYSFLAAAAAIAVFPVGAVTVDCTPGSLAASVADPADVTELTLTGHINAADLDFIDTSMPALRSLDLGAVVIDAYSGNRLRGASVYAAGEIPARMFVASPVTTIILPSSEALRIGDAAFAGSGLTDLTISANIAGIGHGAFAGCPALCTVTIAAPAVGPGAFSGCTALTSVTVTAPTVLEDGAFAGCTSLATVSGSARITAIGARTFAGNSALETFEFGSTLSAIGDEAFLEAGLVTADLSACADLRSVGAWAFAKMPALVSLNLGNAASVGEGVVFECPRLADMRFSTRATELPAYAYSRNTAMDTTEILHNGISRIGDYAMSGLSDVTTITLPESLEYIGDGAMENMTALESVSLAATAVPATGDNVWNGLDQNRIMLLVPTGSEDSYRAAEQWKEFDIRGVSGITDAVTGPDAVVRARFEGDILVISCDGVDVRAVAVYDIAGTRIAEARAAIPGRFEADLSAFPARIFIAVAATPAGAVALKISRD